MVRLISSNRYMSIDPISTIGSGVTHGTLGIVLGIGDITRIGGTFTIVGHMIGTGIIAMLGIIITTVAHSIPVIPYTLAIMTCKQT